MELNDQVKLKGFLKVQVFDKEGKEVYREEKDNLVCIGAKQAMERLLAQRTGTDHADYEKLWAMYVGTDNTPPVTTQTDLVASVHRQHFDADPSIDVGGVTGLVEMAMTIASGDANGNTLREVGLFSRGDNDTPSLTTNQRMYARQIHGAIEKTAGFTVKYTWRYQITT